MEDKFPILLSYAAGFSRPFINSHQQCFACGTDNSTGFTLRFEINPEGVALGVWQPAQAFRSYPDCIHGGILSTLTDSAIVHALFARGITGVTAELTIRYLHCVRVDTGITVRGWIENTRRRIYQCRAEVVQPGKLAVRASAKFMEMPATPNQGD